VLRPRFSVDCVPGGLDEGFSSVRCFAPGWLFVTLHPCKGTAQILWYLGRYQ
jgi:hypothetical protein